MQEVLTHKIAEILIEVGQTHEIFTNIYRWLRKEAIENENFEN